MTDSCSKQCNETHVLLHSASQAVQTQSATTMDEAMLLVRQANTDEQLIAMWLHGRPDGTQTVYRADVGRMFRFINKPLQQITLGELQSFADQLEAEDLATATRHRILAANKSLFSFGHKLGYLPFDVGRPLRLPKVQDRLAERILDEPSVQRMIALEPNPRNRTLLLVLYGSGIRVSEIATLKWRNCQPRNNSGQIAVLGKGGKTRVILLPSAVWTPLYSLATIKEPEAFVFKSRQGGHLSRSQIMRIVRRSAKIAGIEKNISPHFLRHAHASHALDRSAPIHLVQKTLGHASIQTTGRYAHARPDESSSSYLSL